MSQENSQIRIVSTQRNIDRQQDVFKLEANASLASEKSRRLQQSVNETQSNTTVTTVNQLTAPNFVKNLDHNATKENIMPQTHIDVVNNKQSSMLCTTNINEQSTLQNGLSDIKSWGPIQQWNDSLWQKFEHIVESGVTGEELMKVFNFTRRKDLESVFYKLSQYSNKLYSIAWNVDFENGERSLSDLKFGKDCLRITDKRLKRHGIYM